MDSSPTRTEFGAPFDFPDANLILLTSDNVIFRVHRGLLSMVSATIATFPFELSMDPADEHDGIPVFPMSSETQLGVEHVLRLVYPVERPTWTTLAEVHVVLEIARKYQIDVVTQVAIEVLTRDHFMNKQPLGVYALSCAYGLHDLARHTARCTLSIPLGQLEEKDPSLLGVTNGRHLYNLMRYRATCFERVEEALDESGFILPPAYREQWSWLSCQQPETVCPKQGYVEMVDGQLKPPKKWWASYMGEVKRALKRRLDMDIFVRPWLLMEACAEARACPECRIQAGYEMLEYAPLLQERVEQAVSSVELDLS